MSEVQRLAERIPPIPGAIQGPTRDYLELVRRQLNAEAYISKFSGTNPNVSGTTGIPGNLIVNVGAASDNSRLWGMSGSTARSATTGWKQFGLGGSSTQSWNLVVKPSDQTKASDTSLLPDSALSVPVVSGSYVARGFVFLSSANSTMDYKFDLDVVGGLSAGVARVSYTSAGATTGSDTQFDVATNTLPTSTAVVAATIGPANVQFHVFFTMSSAGTLQFLWAQNTSDAGNLTVYAGSYLEYMKTA